MKGEKQGERSWGRRKKYKRKFKQKQYGEVESSTAA